MMRRLKLRSWSPPYYRALFFTYLAGALVIFAVLVPPFQKNDEPAHFVRAVSITNRDMFCEKGSDGKYYFLLKRKYADLSDVMHVSDVAFRGSKFRLEWLRADFSDPKYGETARIAQFCNLPVPGYVPNAVGVLLGKPFENPLVSFYLGRAFGAAFFVGALVVALRIVPERYALSIYFYGALPTVLNQVSAISYDAVQLSLFALITAYLAKFTVEERRIGARELLIFMGLLWWNAQVRSFAYYPMLLLFFAIKPSKISERRSRYVQIAVAFLATTVLTTAYLDATYISQANEIGLPGSGIDPTRQAETVLKYPISFLGACYETLRIGGESLLRESIGVFGWRNVALSYLPYYVAVFCAGMVFYHTAISDERFLSTTQVFVLFAAIALTAASIFFSLYAVSTPVAGKIVQGLQGRYFVGLLPLVVLLVSQAAAALGRERCVKALLVGAASVVLYNIGRAVELRYY